VHHPSWCTPSSARTLTRSWSARRRAAIGPWRHAYTGIGLACCLALAEAGARVLALSNDSGTFAAAVHEAARRGVPLEVVLADVSAEESVAAAFLHPIARVATLLVNAAGIARFGNAETLSLTEWRQVLDVNLTGCFLVAKYALPAMVRQRSGSIVNVSSAVSRVTGPNRRPTPPRNPASKG